MSVTGAGRDAVVVWFRRDLRVHDHPALLEASRTARRVVPLFVLDDALLAGPGSAPARSRFLAESLRSLDADLRTLGSRLVIRRGRAEEVVPALAHEAGAETVLVTRDVTPYARRRDRAVAAALTRDGRSLHARAGLLLAEPERLRTAAGAGFTVFTPFWRALAGAERRPVLPAPRELPPPPPALASDPVPSPAHLVSAHLVGAHGVGDPLVGGHPAGDPLVGDPRPAALPAPGEGAARARLAAWVDDGLGRYADGRNGLAGEGSSHLSQDLHLGLLSVAEVEARCAGSGGAEAFRRQLAWREFYHHLLWHRPDLARSGFQPRYEAAFRPESADPEAAWAWRQGRTGIPSVDAAMRQLAATGWLSNRARLIAASFLTRHLLLDWRVGERHFMRTLIDGDVADNVGGWQWTAGVGTDAQPWFRIFNPVLQGRRFDPDGAWVRTWLPELSRIPGGGVHEPWTLPAEDLRAAGVTIGADYPAPIVDLAAARERALSAFRALSGR